MMNIPLIDLHAQFLSMEDTIKDAIHQVLHSGIYVMGPEVEQFEQEMAAWTQSAYALSTANGTDSLILALEALDIGEGDEVITSPYTFYATAEAISRVGAKPVFVDIDPRTYNLSPDGVELRITPQTKAIIPVHIFGQPAEMDPLLELAERHHLHIVEDACQALGANYKGRSVGSMGHIGCVSFFPTKNLGGYGDGGIVLTDDPQVQRKIKKLANHGSAQKYYHDLIGYNSRLDELQAAILRVKLKKLQAWNHARQNKAAYYTNRLEHNPIQLPYTIPDASHVYHLYIIELASAEVREKLALFLQSVGVATGRYYPCPLHLQKAYASLGYKRGDLPVAEAAAEKTLALPLYPELTLDQQHYITSHIIKFFEA